MIEVVIANLTEQAQLIVNPDQISKSINEWLRALTEHDLALLFKLSVLFGLLLRILLTSEASSLSRSDLPIVKAITADHLQWQIRRCVSFDLWLRASLITTYHSDIRNHRCL